MFRGTTDLYFSAFLKVNGYDPIDFEVLPRNKGKYFFNVTEAEWKKLKLEFVSSDISKIKQAIEELKDLLY